MNQLPGDEQEHARDRSRELFDRPIPGRVLEENTRLFASAPQDETGELVGVLIVRIGGQRLGLPSASISLVDLVPLVHRVPHRKSCLVRGICSIRGRIRPCGDIHDLLGLGRAPQRISVDMRVVMIGDEHLDIAFVVDEVIGVMRCERESIRSLPSEFSGAIQACSERAIVFEGDTLPLLDADRVTAAIEGVLS